MENLYRIDDYALLKEVKTYDIHKFHSKDGQVILADAENWETNRDRTVWFASDFAHRLNRVYDTILYNPEHPDTRERYSANYCLYLRQGFTFQNLFGILFVAQDMVTNEVLTSQLLTENDFSISDTMELVNGTFWIQMCNLIVPRTENNVQVSIAYVTYSDVESSAGDSLGYIYNYPIEFIPLVAEKPMPDFIRTSIDFDDAHFITIRTYTTENKTLERSILDYFGVNMASITVEHVVKYGTANIGYKTLKVSNEDNIYNPVNIGLNLAEFAGEEKVLIFVSTEINVDNKLMKRETYIVTDIFETLNPVIAELIGAPAEIADLKLQKNIQVSNQVIKTEVTQKIVPIIQPVFVAIVSGEIQYERKNVTFDAVLEHCYFVTDKTKKDESQTIMTKQTQDGKYYFDFTELTPISADTNYRIITVKNSRVVGNGLLKAPKE